MENTFTTLKKMIEDDSIVFPSFLTAKKDLHIELMGYLNDMFRIIYQLHREVILSADEADDVLHTILIYLKLILNCADEKMHLRVKSYILNKLDVYEDFAVNNEFYESAANFNNLSKSIIDISKNNLKEI